MGDAIHEAGWPAYPILLLGVIALGLAAWHAYAPRRSLGKLASGLTAATVLMGILGTTLGVIHSGSGLREVPPDQKWIFFLGIKEALNCVAMALVLAVPAVLALAVGNWKRAKREEASG
jgi:hypothetical protein